VPKIFNKHHRNEPADAVYIGRRSPWGNPWTHLPINVHPDLKVSTRLQAIAKFEEWIMQPEQADMVKRAKKELKGKDLVCFCFPKPCHGDILLRIANEE
jgi:hypothetical protein